MSENQLFSLKNKTILITGSSRGLGLLFARGLGEAGASLILNGRNQETVDAAVSKLKKKGLTAAGYAFDITDEDGVVRSIAKINKKVGNIHVLINNAGIQIRSLLEDFKQEDWQKIIDINLTGAFLVAKAVVRRMIERKQGKIINICSIQSELARPSIAPYAATKGGLKMLTRSMATEWGKYNIQVNGVAPGYFDTGMTRPLVEDPEFNAWLCGRTPANRWGKPEELIGPMIFLASDASSYVNGHVLYVDGGMLGCV